MTDTYSINLTVNDRQHSWAVSARTTLADFLRHQLGLTGTHLGCEHGVCGACTVLMDGKRVKACLSLAALVEGREITTIEGLAADGKLHKVQQAWIDQDVPQCGYCQSGMIMAAAALLKDNPKPTDEDIDGAITNICRCGTYQQVRAAIHAAADA